MGEVTIKGVKGQLERTVDEQGRVYVGEWKGQDVVVLLRPREFAEYTNERISDEIPSIIKRYTKAKLLREVEEELGLEINMRGFNDTDDTLSKETMAEILLGVKRIKGQLKIDEL